MKKKYAFYAGSAFKREYAQPIGEFLEHHGTHLKPRDVWALGKSGECPELTACFTPDKTQAAENWWVHQARRILNNLYIVNISAEPVRAYESVRLRIDERAYVSTPEIAADSYLLDQVIANAKRELLYWEAKYSLYRTRLPEIFAAISRLKQEATDGKNSKGKGGRKKRRR